MIRLHTDNGLVVYTTTRVISSTHRNVEGIVRSRGKIAQVVSKITEIVPATVNDSIFNLVLAAYYNLQTTLKYFA